MKRNLKIESNKTGVIVATALIFVLWASLLIAGAGGGKFAYALKMSSLSWGKDVTDAKLNQKNGIPYGTGKGRLVCTTYVSWAVHTHYKVKDYPSGGVVSTHKNWLDGNAQSVCSISSPGRYKAYKETIKPGDIVAFNTKENFGGTWIHIAIVGGDGRTLHHAINKGVAYQYTVEGWLGKAADTTKQASSCKVYRLLIPQDGYIDMTKKVSEETSLVKGLSNYSLSGAKYGVYKEKKGKPVYTFSIDANGNTAKWKTKPGTYYVKESKAPKHFKLDPRWHTVTVKEKETAHFTSSDKPLFTRGSLLLKKKAAQQNKYLPDAVYEIAYYDNDEGNTSGSPKRKWEVKTDANGCADLAGNLISGAPFKDSKNNTVLPFGTYTYREKAAPEGYRLDETVYKVKQTDDVKYNVREALDKKLPPEIKTFATDVSTGNNILSFSTEAKVTDRIEYKNLEKGEEYKIKGYIVDKKTGKPLEINGRRIEAEKSFRPASISGTEELEYTLDSASLRGKALVIFEEVFKDDVSVVSHTDINDENQTLFVPEIGTSATDGKTGEHMTEYSQEAKIIDRVNYKNLVPGREYTISGILMDAESGEAILTEKGEKITNTLAFTPESPDGNVDVEFSVDSKFLAGKTVVVFESCYFKDVRISAHEDLKDSEQIVKIPNLKTTAADGHTGDHSGKNTENGKLTDTVEYHNLIPGKEYTVSGILMDRDTGKPILRESGDPITASKKFKPESGDGKIELEFTFDARLLAGKCAVVFEDCFHGEIKVAGHSDINDKEQSVFYPGIETKATDESKKRKNILLGRKTVINDEVMYTNLIPNKEYEVVGVVIDKRTGSVLKDGKGKQVSSSVRFTPKTPDGSTDVVFKFDAAGMESGDCVIFEELRYQGMTIAEHKDINNSKQTVTALHNPPDNKTFAKKKTVHKKGKRRVSNNVKTGDASPLRRLVAFFIFSKLLLLVILKKRCKDLN